MLETGRSKGLTPNQMLDPGSSHYKDYGGALRAEYVKSAQEKMNDMSKKMQEDFGKKKIPIEERYNQLVKGLPKTAETNMSVPPEKDPLTLYNQAIEDQTNNQ
jgi:hypothetical protein